MTDSKILFGTVLVNEKVGLSQEAKLKDKNRKSAHERTYANQIA
jgi:hypothetical protein